jgi:hypothetical protein
LCIDVHILTESGIVSAPVEKFHEFTRVARLRSARKMVAFHDAHPDLEDRTTLSRAFLQTPDLEASIDAAAKNLWGIDKKGKTILTRHWSGLNLERRSHECGVLCEEAYSRWVAWFNWYVHSGASGTGGVSAEGLSSLELVARDLIGRFVPEAYRRIGVAMHLHRAMPDFALKSMHLVKDVEVRSFGEFSHADLS